MVVGELTGMVPGSNSMSGGGDVGGGGGGGEDDGGGGGVVVAAEGLDQAALEEARVARARAREEAREARVDYEF